MKRERMITLKLPLSKVVPVVENHGGYMVMRCIICDAVGWDGGPAGMKHKRSCPVAKKFGIRAGAEGEE